VLTGAAKCQQEKIVDGDCMGTKICHGTTQIPSLRLLMKKKFAK
jgi:hypothetical protein